MHRLEQKHAKRGVAARKRAGAAKEGKKLAYKEQSAASAVQKHIRGQQARKEVQAVAGAIDWFNEPTMAIPQTRKKSANAEGVIVSLVDNLRVLREEREEKDAAVELVGQNKDKKVRELVDKWLADVRSAE